MDFGRELQRLRTARGLSLRALGALTHYSYGYLHDLERGRKEPPTKTAAALDDALGAGGRLVDAATTGGREMPQTLRDLGSDDEIAALELVRRVSASDVGSETLDQLEAAVDDLAVAYPTTPPTALLGRVQRHLGYVERLLDGRKTLAEHRRLIVAGGWLSLLAATCQIDLLRFAEARARLRTAASLAKHAEHREIAAWALETEAWAVLTAGDFRRAVTLSQGAQELAPSGSSALLQSTAQEARAWARLDAGPETRAALSRLQKLVSPLPQPERPEHHYRYDPAKSDAYVATTLAWIGDPAAEGIARQVAAYMESGGAGVRRPRRAAIARVDLALALLASGKHDEAAGVTLEAVTSGALPPSNHWRAAEVIAAVEARKVPEAVELREAYREISASRDDDA